MREVRYSRAKELLNQIEFIERCIQGHRVQIGELKKELEPLLKAMPKREFNRFLKETGYADVVRKPRGFS